MASQQNFFGHEAQFETGEDAKIKQTQKPISARGASSNDANSCFDCNICFDSARDPVVTLCGHLYCWPCIYKWLHVRRTSVNANEQQPTCPVCKANVSLNLLVPLYGRGSSSSETSSERAAVDVAVPRGPPPSELRTMITNTPDQSQQLHPSILHPHSATTFHPLHYFANPYEGYTAMSTSNLGGAALMSFFHPTVGMFRELMFARIFQTTDTNLFTNSPAGNVIPRMRRQEMQLDKSLNRVTVFLLCCILLCLLLF